MRKREEPFMMSIEITYLVQSQEREREKETEGQRYIKRVEFNLGNFVDYKEKYIYNEILMKSKTILRIAIILFMHW